MPDVPGNSPDQESQALLQSIQRSPIATIVTDMSLPDEPIVAANDAFCALTGYGRSEIVGRNCRFLSGPKTDPDARRTLREAVTRGSPVLIELTNYRKDGSIFQNAVMIAPVKDGAGRLRYYIGSQMDVTGTSPLPSLQRRSISALVESLTARQRQVLDMMVAGYRNKQIAGFLGIGEKTVKMHRAMLLRKLGVPTSADAIRMAVQSGL